MVPQAVPSCRCHWSCGTDRLAWWFRVIPDGDIKNVPRPDAILEFAISLSSVILGRATLGRGRIGQSGAGSTDKHSPFCRDRNSVLLFDDVFAHRRHIAARKSVQPLIKVTDTNNGINFILDSSLFIYHFGRVIILCTINSKSPCTFTLQLIE